MHSSIFFSKDSPKLHLCLIFNRSFIHLVIGFIQIALISIAVMMEAGTWESLFLLCALLWFSRFSLRHLGFRMFRLGVEGVIVVKRNFEGRDHLKLICL